MTMSPAPFSHWFALGCMAGLRISEIANLEGNWLELKYDGTYNLRVRGKGGTILVVPACDYLVEMIQSYNTQGRLWAIQDRYMCRLVNREMERIGVKPKGRSVISFHSTRHYFATTFLIASGKDWDATREVMRHSSLTTTQGYAGVVNDQNHVVVNKAFNQYKFSG
jgi:integrase/recombinase XerD